MIKEEVIRKILRDKYHINTGNLISSYEEFEKCFKLYHKHLSGECNANFEGKHKITRKYCIERDYGKHKTLALSECIEIISQL